MQASQTPAQVRGQQLGTGYTRRGSETVQVVRPPFGSNTQSTGFFYTLTAADVLPSVVLVALLFIQ